MKQYCSIFLVLFCISSFSQSFNGGLISGIATSQVSGDNLGGYNKAGFLFGIYTQYPLSEISNLQLEINYIEKGSNNPKMIENNIPDISLSYIEIPLIFNYNQNEKMNFEFGIQSALLISSSDNDIIGPINPINSIEFKKNDTGLLLGMSYLINQKIALNTRISNSILPMRKHAEGNTYLFNKGQYNTVLSFSLKFIII